MFGGDGERRWVTRYTMHLRGWFGNSPIVATTKNGNGLRLVGCQPLRKALPNLAGMTRTTLKNAAVRNRAAQIGQHAERRVVSQFDCGVGNFSDCSKIACLFSLNLFCSSASIAVSKSVNFTGVCTRPAAIAGVTPRVL